MLNRWKPLLASLCIVFIAGCNTTSVKPFNGASLSVGPTASQPKTQGATEKVYESIGEIYLDVAIPVFDTGIPMLSDGSMNYEDVEKQGVWPQLRRAEAKKFALYTKEALAETKAFGSVSVTPSANTTADIFVQGKILESDSETIVIKVTVSDSSAAILGSKKIKYRVSEGFFRDAQNKGENPYEPAFIKVANYVHRLMKKKEPQELQAIQNMTKVRYAQYYSPESYNQYLGMKTVYFPKRYNKVVLLGMPSDEDRMMQRIEALHNQEKMFIDRLQDQYAAFDGATNEHYREWQKETLPEAKAAREARNARNTKAIIGGLLAVAAVAAGNQSNHVDTQIGQGVALLGAAALAKSAMNSNEEFKVHKESLDEMGENLDIAMSPSVMEFDEKEVELTGTAGEQYEQWKAHLKSIYEVETGNMQKL